jgi:proline dehydrogenase
MRSGFLWLSRRRSVGRLATRLPVTRSMVSRFVAGETLPEALTALERLRDAGFRTTVDVLGEAVTTRAAADTAADEYLATLALWRELRPINAGRGDSGVVIQAALRRSADDVDALVAEAARVRLCKGAYVEPASVAYPDKSDVDEAYGSLMERLLLEGTFPALATHDERIVARAVAFARERGIQPDRFEFQMLYGVRRDLQDRLVRAGFGVRVYVPFGTQWYPYFMRRLAERPANVAFVLRSVLRERRPS